MNKPQESYARRMFRESARRYFAPLTGAIRGVRAELIRSQRKMERMKSGSRD